MPWYRQHCTGGDEAWYNRRGAALQATGNGEGVSALRLQLLHCRVSACIGVMWGRKWLKDLGAEVKGRGGGGGVLVEGEGGQSACAAAACLTCDTRVTLTCDTRETLTCDTRVTLTCDTRVTCCETCSVCAWMSLRQHTCCCCACSESRWQAAVRVKDSEYLRTSR